MAGFQPINLTSLAFQWLLDIGLVEFKDGHGFPSGGHVITGQVAANLSYGATLLEALSRVLPADAVQGPHWPRGGSRKDPSAPSERLQAWGALLSIEDGMSEQLRSRISISHQPAHRRHPADDERTLCVACDTSVISTVIHRLAAVTSLSVLAASRPLSPRLRPSIGQPERHPCVLLLSDIAARHLRLGAGQMCRLVALEPDKWRYLVCNVVQQQQRGEGDLSRAPSRVQSHGHAGGESAESVSLWLEEVAGARDRFGGMLQGDAWGTRLVLSALGAGLCSLNRGVVRASCRAIISLCDGGAVDGVERWRWLAGGGEAGGDGLQWILDAHSAHSKDINVCKALGDMLCSICMPERVGHVLTVELPWRMSVREEGYSVFMADMCAVFVGNAKVRQELEWHGLVPFLVNYALRDVHVVRDDATRAAAIDLLVEVWRGFSNVVVASPQLVTGLLEGVRASLSPTQSPLMRCSGCESACELLKLMIDQRCTVAAQVYQIVTGCLEESYGDEMVRTRIQANLKGVIAISGLIPLRPITRMLPGHPQKYGTSLSDLEFWGALAVHPRIEPTEVMTVIDLMSIAAVQYPLLARVAGEQIRDVGGLLERHPPVKQQLFKFVYSSLSILRGGRMEEMGVLEARCTAKSSKAR